MTAPSISDLASDLFRPRAVVTPDALPAFPASVRDAAVALGGQTTAASPATSADGDVEPQEGGPDDPATLAALAGETPAPETDAPAENADAEPEETPPSPDAAAQAAARARTGRTDPALTVPHTDRLARLTDQLMNGSPDVAARARATLDADPHGRRVVDAWDRAHPRIAATDGRALTVAEQTFAELQRMRTDSPAEFGRRMADPAWRRWYDTMEDWTAAGETAVAASDPVVDAAWTALQARPGADLLSPEDWEQVDPDPDAATDPATTVVEMTARFERLVARRKVEAARAPVAARAARLSSENDALRRARAAAPPAVGTSAAPPADMSTLREQFLAGVDAGTNTRAEREAYYRARSAERAAGRSGGGAAWPW